MNATAPYLLRPTHWPAVPDDVLQLVTQRALAALHDDGTWPVAQRLADYYDAEGDAVGASLTELAPNEWCDVTAADLHATSLMGDTIGARATRRLLSSGPQRTWVVEALRRLPDQELLLADPATLAAMEDFHSAVEHALSDTDTRRSHRSIAASGLAARKRPELFPVRDRIVCEYLGILALKDVRSDWLVFRALLQDDRIRRALLELPDAVARASGERTVILESSDLRLLHAALWTHACQGLPDRSVEAHGI